MQYEVCPLWDSSYSDSNSFKKFQQLVNKSEVNLSSKIGDIKIGVGTKSWTHFTDRVNQTDYVVEFHPKEPKQFRLKITVLDDNVSWYEQFGYPNEVIEIIKKSLKGEFKIPGASTVTLKQYLKRLVNNRIESSDLQNLLFNRTYHCAETYVLMQKKGLTVTFDIYRNGTDVEEEPFAQIRFEGYNIEDKANCYWTTYSNSAYSGDGSSKVRSDLGLMQTACLQVLVSWNPLMLTPGQKLLFTNPKEGTLEGNVISVEKTQALVYLQGIGGNYVDLGEIQHGNCLLHKLDGESLDSLELVSSVDKEGETSDEY